MEAILIKSRYKVTYIEQTQENYAALLAVDVESREKEEYLLNVYEGGLVKRYVDSFERLRHCQEYKGMFMTQGALVARFSAQGGTPIDEVFFKGAKLEWTRRTTFAQLIFHLGLSTSDFPPEIGCTALLSQNLRVWLKDGRLEVNYAIIPLEGMNQREMALLTIDQIKKVLLRRYDSPNEEIKFLESLDKEIFLTPVALYSHWLNSKDKITADYEKLYKKSGLQRFLYLLVQNMLRFGKRMLKRKR